ncbi:glycoside hydrolase [Pedobacter petrophilus]|uniref:Glycoside hydrolase n=1 Tax=Pedobacter petrophilus TaxID=1908241 RepID=A0A7K0G0X3_9SPHI|nr:glycoside hydrolase family 38 C-terminal domain-containing protein [Pedobacter petrophilus]MRX76984.1 glycoside hydrolase [Pedobacter petrophilus]
MKYTLLLCFLSTIAFGQQKKIYIALDDHTDYVWTGDEEKYKNTFLETLDYYIKLNDSTAKQPYAYQNKWNCDGSYWVYTYQKNKSPEQFNKLITQIKAGQITVPLNSMIVLMGAAPAEATLRDMYYAGSLKRKYGLDMPLVLNMEDQVLPLGLSSLWAGSGAKYSWRGVCACASKVTGLETRKNQMYWYKGLDDQQVLMKWYAVNPAIITKRKDHRYFMGTYLEAFNPEHAVEDCKDLMRDTKNYPYSISGAFGKGGDSLKTLTNTFPKIARAKTDADYQVIVSNEIDFFKDFEKQYGNKLPSETFSYGTTEWGNSFASLAEVSASVKRSVEKLRAAEALYTLVALKDKKFASNLEDMKEKAWFACGMYFEHDWTADGPYITRKQRADWQRKVAAQLNSYVDTLYSQSSKRLGELVTKQANGNEAFYVFNPLSWKRTDYSDYLYRGNANVTVIDKTSMKAVPSQIIMKKNQSYLRILASDVPSLGYKVFEIRKNTTTTWKNGLSAAGNTIENEYYKITLTAQGVVTRLWDKQNKKECIKPFKKMYFNDLGSGLADEGEPIRIENRGPVSVTLVASSYKPIKHTSKITLFAGNERVEIENYITQNLDAKPVTYSFALNIDKPETWHEEAGAILKAQTVAKGGHYADSICRLDWLAMNHFADMSDKNYGMVLSNREAYFMKTGESSVSNFDDSTALIKVLAAGQIDEGLGIINQDGDSYFENFLALKPHTGSFKAADAMRFSLQHQNPLVSHQITGGSAYPEKQFSLFSISDPNVLVWALKPAEEGIDKGIVMRVWNLANEEINYAIKGNTSILKASKITHIETDDEPIKTGENDLKTVIGHNRIQTYKLFLK